jgi:hypothetical protein
MANAMMMRRRERGSTVELRGREIARLDATAGTNDHQAVELLPKAFDRLQGNDTAQVWILGDQVVSDVRRLLAAGREAPGREPKFY